jgi:hypothetical protein
MTDAGDLADTNKPDVFFAADFFSSRQRFIEQTSRLDASLTTLSIPSISSDQLPTAHNPPIDIALIGNPKDRPTLFYIAGTHGIEGFVGSAIQSAILSQLKAPPENFALALVHCLNPWGMAYLRRANAHNIDLNRNCTQSDHERVGAPPGYENLRSLLSPERALWFPLFCGQALSAVIRYGFPAAKQAITGGQYIDSEGLFFGGATLQPELELVRSWAKEHLSHSPRILVVDLHSGLGSFCQDTLIVDSSEGSPETSRIKELFPQEKIHGPDPTQSLSYETRGSLSSLLTPALPEATIDYVVHEFGTLHPFRVLHALVQENYHHHHSNRDGEVNQRGHIGKRLLKAAFCPESEIWRRNAIRRGVEIFQAAAWGVGRIRGRD